jgi:hypothetical protein
MKNKEEVSIVLRTADINKKAPTTKMMVSAEVFLAASLDVVNFVLDKNHVLNVLKINYLMKTSRDKTFNLQLSPNFFYNFSGIFCIL